MPRTTVPARSNSAAQSKKKTPRAGRKMSKKEAREHVFATYRETMTLLAKH
jgi:hypothetical protein